MNRPRKLKQKNIFIYLFIFLLRFLINLKYIYIKMIKKKNFKKKKIKE